MLDHIHPQREESKEAVWLRPSVFPRPPGQGLAAPCGAAHHSLHAELRARPRGRVPPFPHSFAVSCCLWGYGCLSSAYRCVSPTERGSPMDRTSPPLSDERWLSCWPLPSVWGEEASGKPFAVTVSNSVECFPFPQVVTEESVHVYCDLKWLCSLLVR